MCVLALIKGASKFPKAEFQRAIPPYLHQIRSVNHATRHIIEHTRDKLKSSCPVELQCLTHSLQSKFFSHASRDRDSVGFIVKSNVDLQAVSWHATSHRCDAFSVQNMIHTHALTCRLCIGLLKCAWQ